MTIFPTILMQPTTFSTGLILLTATLLSSTLAMDLRANVKSIPASFTQDNIPLDLKTILEEGETPSFAQPNDPSKSKQRSRAYSLPSWKNKVTVNSKKDRSYQQIFRIIAPYYDTIKFLQGGIGLCLSIPYVHRARCIRILNFHVRHLVSQGGKSIHGGSPSLPTVSPSSLTSSISSFYRNNRLASSALSFKSSSSQKLEDVDVYKSELYLLEEDGSEDSYLRRIHRYHNKVPIKVGSILSLFAGSRLTEDLSSSSSSAVSSSNQSGSLSFMGVKIPFARKSGGSSSSGSSFPSSSPSPRTRPHTSPSAYIHDGIMSQRNTIENLIHAAVDSTRMHNSFSILMNHLSETKDDSIPNRLWIEIAQDLRNIVNIFQEVILHIISQQYSSVHSPIVHGLKEKIKKNEDRSDRLIHLAIDPSMYRKLWRTHNSPPT
ncbi:hypothetical protein BJ684DRAFT_15052 [Piptocephalis cylindrospora]|uniref:Uncharacterized protein n=1 Tax=Piptocephalis cylindrospora TaxID=1907219 RepID=A0A4P9Y6I3_9FUNG|nr:hypothetical protein BJ684DRAFT_15052 [Piptocephalis cylindrospora]|eukprot:RKP14625.1 hypothetical protein BJ684DRAFT_15052 [Piptocephalis cylindrospora]